MSEVPKSDTNSESSSSRKNGEKEEENSEEAKEQTEKEETGKDNPDIVENPDEIYTSSPEEIKKSVKSDLGVLIVNENEKKLNESVKIEVDKTSKCNSVCEEEENVPPALPPRPPPRPRQPCTCSCELDERELQERNEREVPRSCWSNGLRKYVFLCTACGSLSILLGALFLIVYFMLKSYTSSLNHFETIPTYVPSGMLIATGFLIICLACRKNRNSFLMKLCGLCSLCCAVLCVSVTVTTTVIHMNRLQTLRECLYTLKTQSCTCYSVLMDNDRVSDEGIKFVFNSTPDCEVIHGALYSCLRAIFGLSVIGILVCIFSCMLVYQLLSHEKKKMYWAQLEMRCRYLYRQQRHPHYYSCCDECRYPLHPHELFPWDFTGNRFWSTGRIGNLYTPNPEERGNHNRLRSGWNWRRLPWSRSGTNSNEPTRANLGSPDSQYGFSSTPTVDGTPYTVLDPRTSTGISTCHPELSSTPGITEGGFYSWGPPPPYASNRNSANNSPARRSLGDILHQVSPIRRNDSVSPARSLHHQHRHHLHHNRQCSSSSRQMPNNSQTPADSYQKGNSRGNSITNAIQQQQQNHGMDPMWSNSLNSVHRYQKVIQNKTNYENMYNTENVLPANGFNTLPSLKKRNQPRASEIFQNDTNTAYFFSSAENLGCSNNFKMETPNNNFPPRVFLNSSQPNIQRYGPTSTPVSQNYSVKDQTDLNYLESSNQPENEVGSTAVESRNFRPMDSNTSLVKKLFVNCSPSKQKPRNSQGSQAYLVDRGDGVLQPSRRKQNKKVESHDVGVETSNENVITFHYRVGLPRSPDVQNFNQYMDKSPYKKNSQEESGSDLSKDKVSYTEIPSKENQTSRIPKYIEKDLEILRKHKSLISEFHKTLDSNKKFRNIRIQSVKFSGIDNEGYNPQNPDSPQNFQPDPRQGPIVRYMTFENGTNIPTINETQLTGYPVTNENESDVYFGDISNSSCYMSLQNDGLESFPYEEAAEERMNPAMFPINGHPVLNKANLQTMEWNNETMEQENSGYSEMSLRHENQTENYGRHQDVIPQNYKLRNNRPNNQYQVSNEKTGENLWELLQDTKLQEVSKKSSRRYNETLDNKTKYFKHNVQDHYRQPDRHQEPVTSNDEQSSGNLTADSGISSGRSFLPTGFNSAYHEIPPQGNESNRGFDERSVASNEKVFSFPSKISNLAFSHPLFQKPKVLPRGNRYKEMESLQKNNFELEESESGNDGELDCQNKRKRSFQPKVKTMEMSEEVSNQLLSTCNLTLTRDPDHFYEEDHFDSLHRNQDKSTSQVTLKKSPKPLPRTSVVNKNSGENNDLNIGKLPRYLQEKDTLGHFIAPDAQYEFQENSNSDLRPKTPVKNQNLSKTKPAVPARPLNLQVEPNKSEKALNDMSNMRMMRTGKESVCPVPRRRQNYLDDESEEKDNDGMESHAVNV